MGLSASQGRMLLLTARKSDLEFRAQQISQRRLILSQQLEDIAMTYEEATSNRQMKINLLAAGTEPKDGINRTANLTYATLVSGTLSRGWTGEDAGIVAYSRTSDQDYVSNNAYRLTDAYGAIVVSDASEIPATKSNIIVSPQHYNSSTNGQETALYRYITQNGYNKEDLVVDTTNQMVQVGGKYFAYNTGVEYTEAENINKFVPNATATLVLKDNTTARAEAQLRQVRGADGRITVFDANNNVVGRYVIDPSLKYGTSDGESDTVGPNYLQDCLRNGKYLLQKGDVNTETNKVQWKSLSWDATSNINDNYYTEDDDVAKAKYDRLQNQIQNQDKKLELELDNIETQRSAVTTEIESVQKVIDDNIQDSFKVFNA
ncbi:hypothetical protein IJ531_06705 [bacterium]|nr:hypothetical protein [bacterium]